VKTTSAASSASPASSRIGASDVPVHSALPTASVSHGWLIGRGESLALPLPAHSSVTASVVVGRDLRSSIVNRSGLRTRPPTTSSYDFASTKGMSKWMRR